MLATLEKMMLVSMLVTGALVHVRLTDRHSAPAKITVMTKRVFEADKVLR